MPFVIYVREAFASGDQDAIFRCSPFAESELESNAYFLRRSAIKTMMKATLILALPVLAVLTGCSTAGEGSLQGTVIASPEVVRPAPDLSFKDDKGQIYRFSALWGDATIIALIEQECVSSDSTLVAISNTFKDEITVLEICIHPEPEGCKHHGDCVKVRGDRARNLISVCDGQGLIRKAFGVSTADAVFLVDHRGMIRAEGRLSDLNAIRSMAIRLVEEAEKEQEESIAG